MEAATAAEALLISEEAKMNTLVKELETQLEVIKKELDVIKDVYKYRDTFFKRKDKIIQPIYNETLSSVQLKLEASPIDSIMHPVVETAEKFEDFRGKRDYKGEKYSYVEIFSAVYERYEPPKVCSGTATLHELLDRHCHTLANMHRSAFSETKILRDMETLMKAIEEEYDFYYSLRILINGQFREFKPEIVYRNLQLIWYQYMHDDFEE